MAQSPDWNKRNAEARLHNQALVRIDSTGPQGSPSRRIRQKDLEAEGIPEIISAKKPASANPSGLISAHGSGKTLMIMDHTNTVKVDSANWTIKTASPRQS